MAARLRRIANSSALWIVLLATACGSDTRSGASTGRLAIDALPDGYAVCFVTDGDADLLAEISDPQPPVVWGDASLPDPLVGPLAIGWVERSDDAADEGYLPVHDDVRPVTVRGRDGYVGAMQLFQGVSSREWGSIVTWAESPGVVIEVALRRGSEQEALDLAEVAIVEGDTVSFAPDALGARTEPLIAGSTVYPFSFGIGMPWAITYGRPGDAEAPWLTIQGVDGGAEALDRMRFWAISTEPFEVRGSDGLLFAGFDETGPWGALWREPDGQVVQITGLMSREDVVAAALSVQELDERGWNAVAEADNNC